MSAVFSAPVDASGHCPFVAAGIALHLQPKSIVIARDIFDMGARGIEHAEAGVGAAVLARRSFRQAKGAEQDRNVTVQGDNSERTAADYRHEHQDPFELPDAGTELFEHCNHENQAEERGN